MVGVSMLCNTMGGALRMSNSPGFESRLPMLPSEPFGPAICAARSSPAQKARPVPVRMMQRTSRARSASSSRSDSSSSIAPEMVFIRCGALRVMVAT